MAKRPDKFMSLSDALREALAECGSFLQVERATGVKRQTMSRFLRGMNSLRLDKADDLARYFGIECKRRKGR